jgi:hypothetical protein
MLDNLPERTYNLKMIERNQMDKIKTRAEMWAESEALMKDFLAKGGQVIHEKTKKDPRKITASVKNKGGRVFSDPTARFPKR